MEKISDSVNKIARFFFGGGQCGRLSTVKISHAQRKSVEFYATAEVYFGYTLTFLEERHHFEVVN